MDELYNLVESDDDDVQEYLNYINRQRRPRIMREKPDHFLRWDAEDFFVRFRLSKETVQRIINEVSETIASPTERNSALSPALMVLIAIRFYATGSFLVTVGDFAGIHKSTASKVVRKVSCALASLRHRYIRFPETEDEVTIVRQKFYNIAKFPRCVGSVDCTHIKIQSPGGEMAETFRNRKGFFSINVQTIGDPDLKLLNIVACWPGASHDSTIFNNSNIRNKFERGEMTDSLLVGDSGYGIKNYLITPLSAPVTRAEQLFNESLIRTRNPVERQYGVWKRRFPILALGIRLKLESVEAVIVATAVLHNIACEMREANPPVHEDIEAAVNLTEDVQNGGYQGANNNGIGPNNLMRSTLIHQYFQELL